MHKIRALLLTLLLLPLATLMAEEEPLDPEVAFALSVESIDANTVRASWSIAEGYYLYRNKFRFKSDTPGITLGEPLLPEGKVKHDEFFGDVVIYRGTISIDIPLTRGADAANSLTLTATSQGCADMGICYPPHRQTRSISLAAASIASSPLGQLSGLGEQLSFNNEEPEILDVDDAFGFSTLVVDGNTLIARWEIAPGHYLYKDKFSFSLSEAEGITLGEASMPAGEEKNDEFFGRIEVYHDLVEARLPLQRSSTEPASLTLNVKYQGCAEVTGICYPPQKRAVSIDLPEANSVSSSTPTPRAGAASTPAVSEQDQLAAALAGGDTAWTILLFFVAGLLLAFTPCVFPMIPILSSIIVGQGDGMTTRKAFVLSVVYVLAMAVTYTVAGVIAGLFGANLQAAFQNPWILGSFAGVFVALSLSMFGFYELQLPSSLQGKLTEISNKQQGGSLIGVAIMGLLSALIVGPCVAPPLMGALIYIGQTGDPYLGGAALFALSMGMGAPLVAIGTAGGKFLPRAGGWMDAVKAVFGVMLLAVAIWMLERILPATVIMLLWALLLIISAVYMGATDGVREGASGWSKLWKGLGLVLLLQGVLLLIGLAVGNTDPLQPLRGVGSGTAATAQAAHLEFRTIKSLDDLEREVASASAAGKPVMLDFYADWCISCKEFEKYTFANRDVQQALSGVVLLQADVTANDDLDKALLKHFKLIGPPAIIFYAASGSELSDYRVVGYQPADEFRAHINRALGR